jgi:hypothetical protein
MAAFASFGARSIEAMEDDLQADAENFFHHSMER